MSDLNLPYSFDFDTAVAAHKVWLRHLEFFMDGIEPDRIDLDTAGDAGLCSLGQWLDGSGRQYESLPHFARLVAVHREFHQVAGEIVRYVREDRIAEADLLLKGRMSELSANIVSLIEAMKREFHAAQG
jgi:hypothetical protein